MKDEPLVSVVIPTFNSGRFLERCLLSVRGQSYGRVEVVVVDNYSKDGTREIAEKYGVKFVLQRAGMSRARNIGASFAKGEFIFSVDSDMELAPNVVSECVSKVEEGFDAVIIPEFSVGEGFWAKCKALEKQCYVGDDLIEAARFFRRDVFEALEGYDVKLLFGEDWDLNLRIAKAGHSVGRIRAYIKHHEGALSLRETMLKKHYYGKTLELYRVKHSEEAKQQLTLMRPSFAKNWRKLARDPIHAAGLVALKICEFAAVGLVI
jgi:glycosyltransferase involved in cell wall biosynthesis